MNIVEEGTMIKYGVILAAGDGGRLAPFTQHVPKPLVPVLGKPMIDYTLESMAKAGIRDLVVVTGFRAEALRQYLGDGCHHGLRVQFIHNPAFESGNALSLYIAREALAGDTFLLTMADHLISLALLEEALKSDSKYCTLCIDYLPHPFQVEEATKVWVAKRDRIHKIGKGLKKWNAVDAGVFILTPEIFKGIEDILIKRGDCELSEAATWLIEKGPGVRACNVSGTFWFDVDTPFDLEIAEKILRKYCYEEDIQP